MRSIFASIFILTTFFASVYATALTFRLEAHERSCYYVWNDVPGKKVSFYFSVQQGGSFDIDYIVMGPEEKVILDGEKERSGDYVFTANSQGEYRICFNNGMSTFAEKVIDFEIALEHEVRPDLPSKGTKEPSAEENALEETLIRIMSGLQQITRTQKYFRTRERRNMYTVESTESRIFWFSVLEGLTIVGMGLLQVFIVRMFFSSRSKKGYV